MHNPEFTKISEHPLILALSEQYACQIKALREQEQTKIGNLYAEFRIKYAVLKEEILKAESESAAGQLTTLASDRHPSCS